MAYSNACRDLSRWRVPFSGPCARVTFGRRRSSSKQAFSTSESSGRLYPQAPMFVTYHHSKRLQLELRALCRHRTLGDRAEVPTLGPFSPAFRLPERYDRSRPEKCNSEANLCAFQCHPERASFPHEVRGVVLR